MQNIVLTVLAVIAAIVWIIYFAEKFRTALHMLQQESYLNISYLKWVKKNLKKNIRVLDLFAPVLAFAIWFLSKETALGIFAVLAAFSSWYIKKTRPKAKKKLVYTARVKRLVATGSVLTLALAVLFAWMFISGISYTFLIMAASNVLMFVFASLVNIINRPIELYINHWYYSDAKKIMKSRDNLKTVGVTGSYGKTSSKFILAQILAEKFSTLATPESYNTTMGVIKTVRMNLQRTNEVFVCEMGAKYVGDIKEICDFVFPKYALITSIGPQHLETFKNIGNIVKTKFELYDAVEDKSHVFVNVSSKLIKENLPKGVKTYSLEKQDGGMYYAENISYSPDGAVFDFCGEGIEPVRLQTKLLGKHNILNVIGAAAIALEMGMTPSQIAVGVRKIKPVTHRLELKRHANGVAVIDDAFNSNVEGAKSAVEVLGSFEKGKRMLITPGMIELGDKQYEYNYEFGVQAAKYCDFITLVGKKQTVPIKEGILSAGFDEKNLYVAENLDDALAKMNEICTAGWTVLFENDLPDLYV